MIKKRLLRCMYISATFVLLISLRYHFFFLHLPERNIIQNPDIFLSPANGKIIAIVTGANDPVVKNHRVVVENAMKDTGT